MKKFLCLLASVATLFLTACATNPQYPVSLSHGELVRGEKVGIYIDKLPEVNTGFPGADCLLCIGVASAAHTALTAHVKSLSADDFLTVAEGLNNEISRVGSSVVPIEESINFRKLPKHKTKELNFAKKNFSSFKKKYDIGSLLVIDINAIGVHRGYASYVPTGDPQAVLLGTAYMVDLETNAYRWYKPISIYRSAEGDWKEKPSYPGLTNAFYQVIEQGKDEILSPFRAVEPVSQSED
ncbi:hypothetical protein KFE80_02740 [bacterium SCSIO 12696]|nr:hypothetical protein KFE80_02740 [bacterium SCSIO 12696]